MTKRLFLLTAALILCSALARRADAQQLYISHVEVVYNNSSLVVAGSSRSVQYCNDGLAPGYAAGEAMSFRPDYGDPTIWSARIEWEHPRVTTSGPSQAVYPGGCLKLCASVTCVNQAGGGAFGVDKLEFEIFKFGNESNPLDPASTPPLRTIPLFNIGICPADVVVATDIGTYCTGWDGSYNLNGQFGKTNGQFGFRATVETNQTSVSVGNISITQTTAYPGQTQYPITVDVINVHSVISSPTVVGRVTGVASEPYNLMYRLSKEANVTVKVFPTTVDHWDQASQSWINPIRTIVDNVPRVGEGAFNGTLTNGDFWDGRDDGGSLVSSGVYVAFINAEGRDYFGLDSAYGSTAYFSVDPLQITDVGVKPLGATSTDQAVISYLLTEPALVSVGIYSTGTSFDDVNVSPPQIKVGTGSRLRLITEQKDRRQQVSTVWDGRDKDGNILPDGDYVYAVWAELPSANGAGGIIRTQKTMTGFLPVSRGLVVSFISPSSTVIGSSPAASEVAPFYFRYTPVRSALFTLNILPRDSTAPIRHLSFSQVRVGGNPVREIWNGLDDSGVYVSSGIYVAELIARDELTSGGVSTTTVQFAVNMFRAVDVITRPLLGGTSDMASISYELTSSLYVNFRVYDIGHVVNPSLSDWATNTASLGALVYSVSGMRPGRSRITEFWDGRLDDGTLAPDGRYPYTFTACTGPDGAGICVMDLVHGYLDISRGQIIFLAFDIIPNVPTLYNSSSPVTLPPYEINYMLSRQAMVKVNVLDSNKVLVSTVIPERVSEAYAYREANILYREFWDGKHTTAYGLTGDFVKPGAYDIRVVARDVGGAAIFTGTTVQQTIEVNPLRIFDMAITPMTKESQAAIISYQVSEPMSVITRIYRPGTSLASSCSDLTAAKDGCAANLVKMFAGVRPARTQIFEAWDGTDRTLSKVPDGNYVFRVYGTTSTEKVSMLTGQMGATAVEVEDVIVANLPVVNGPGGDDAQLKQDTFFAPNPYTGTAGWFNLPIYTNSEVSIKIYNLAGDLIYTYAEALEGGQVKKHYWPKVNDAGNEVKPGVYFAVIRYEGRDGGRGELQMVKKILIP